MSQLDIVMSVGKYACSPSSASVHKVSEWVYELCFKMSAQLNRTAIVESLCAYNSIKCTV